MTSSIRRAAADARKTASPAVTAVSTWVTCAPIVVVPSHSPMPRATSHAAAAVARPATSTRPSERTIALPSSPPMRARTTRSRAIEANT